MEGSGLSDLGAKPAQDATVVGLYQLTGKTARVVAAVEVPGRVRRARVDLRFGALRTMPLIPSLDDIVVDNGEHDIVDIFERLQAWAEAQ